MKKRLLKWAYVKRWDERRYKKLKALLLRADWNVALTRLCLFLILKMMKMKAEARLDLLRQVGVAVETWLKSAMNQVMEELENECWKNLSSPEVSLSVRPTDY